MLDGELRHSDSMGHTEVLHRDEVQAMSAGTGIFHSEFNNLPDKPLKLLQIWVFPEQRNIKPRYEQKAFDPNFRNNQWQLLVAPNQTDGALDMKQKSWFSRIDLTRGKSATYELNLRENGVYLFVIGGKITVENDLQLGERDGAGIWEADKISVLAEEDSELLAIEVPMLE